MPYCKKCGSEVREDMAFCPRCGAALKVEKPAVEVRRAEKAEKSEKQEKEEKMEKTEKHEKREFGVIGPLAGGLILIFAGFLLYLAVTGYLGWQVIGPLLLIIVGVIILVGIVYGVMTATRRHPKT
jgi:pilus assembly protein TadC